VFFYSQSMVGTYLEELTFVVINGMSWFALKRLKPIQDQCLTSTYRRSVCNLPTSSKKLPCNVTLWLRRISYIGARLLNACGRYIVQLCITFTSTFKTQSCIALQPYCLCHENEEVTMILIKRYDNT
jgi:hypothetical protein